MAWSLENNHIDELISVMIVDDHELVREAIKALLNKEGDFRVVFESRNGKEAVDSYEHAKPDVVLMDVIMPGMNGIEATKLITKKYQNSKIIMLTSVDSDEAIVDALASGAKGYCLKSVSAEHLADGVRIVNSGDIWLCSNVSKTYAKEIKKEARSKKRPLKKTVEDRFPNAGKQTSDTYEQTALKKKAEDKTLRD